MNSSGKVLTIFLVIIAILLISLTAISLFFFQQETEKRKLTETTLEEVREEKAKLEEDLKDIKKQNFLLQEKNKEADERINDLSDELELEKGLREEMKLEAEELQKKLDEAVAEKQEISGLIDETKDLQQQMIADITKSDMRIRELESQLAQEKRRTAKLDELIRKKEQEAASRAQAQEQQAAAETRAVEQTTLAPGGEPQPADSDGNAPADKESFGVELGEIVVVPGGRELEPGPDKTPVVVAADDAPGRILSVDIETKFVIVSLGKVDGLEAGDILSVYRNEKYVGDLKITRLQPEMAAADPVPPFEITSVKKNDEVRVK